MEPYSIYLLSDMIIEALLLLYLVVLNCGIDVFHAMDLGGDGLFLACSYQ